ncbi:MAG: hypothetical protein AABW49_04965 [Nanoarchaeota archaeon]
MLYKQKNLSPPQIAKELKVSLSRIYTFLDKTGIRKIEHRKT